MARPTRTGRRPGRIGLFAAGIIFAATLVPAQAVPPIIGPRWTDLAPEKKQILAPLAGEWDDFDAARRKKWVEIADRYPKLSPDEQQRIQTRMRDWAKLTPEQRHAARTRYRNVQNASPEQREALKNMWAQYESLPEDEKQKLKESATSKPRPPVPPKTPAASNRPRPAIPGPALPKKTPRAPPPAPAEIPPGPAAPALQQQTP